MQGSRAQCPVGPRTHGGDDPVKVVDIRFVGTAERAYVDEALSAVPTLEEKALLGQPLLGQSIQKGLSNREALFGYRRQMLESVGGV